MWTKAQDARLEEITAELKRMTGYNAAKLSDKQARHMERLVDEGEALVAQRDTHMKSRGMGAYAAPEEFGLAGVNPGDDDNGIDFKGFIPGLENQIRPTSMYSIDKTQIKALQQAAQQRTSFKVTLGQKGIESGYFGGQLRDKAAITEGGLSPNLLPPIQVPGPRGWYALPYEQTRVANFLPNIAFESAGVAWWSHTANAVEAGYTAEGATKPDITPTVTEHYTRPAKVSGRVNITHELLQDAGDTFSSYLVTDLARSVYNAESNLLLNGTVAANGFNGVNQTSGTLTQALGTDTALDAIQKAMVALRNDFFEPDVLFIHPSTLGALRRTKDTENRYLLQLMEGPRGINQTAETETLWGVQCVSTTQQAAGSAALLSVQSGAAVVYVRETLTTTFDPFSQAASNVYQFIGETRLALATPRPGAICLISGLPTS